MLKLAVVFENVAGKKHNWSFNEPDPNKSPEEIQAALEAMTSLHLFEKNGLRQFCKVVSAKFVETIETSLFDLSKPTPEAYVADPSNTFAAPIISEEVNQISEAPVVNEMIQEEAVVKEASAITKEIITPKADETISQPNEEREFALSQTTPDELTAMIEKAIKPMTFVIPGACVQQLEALKKEAETADSDSPASQNPVNTRKAQMDRLRAYHEANKKKKKKKSKKKKR